MPHSLIEFDTINSDVQFFYERTRNKAGVDIFQEGFDVRIDVIDFAFGAQENFGGTVFEFQR